MQGTRRWALALSLVTCLAASAAATASPALASATQPAHTRSLSTWHKAQKAASFRLVSPTRTYGLRRFGGIIVSSCDVPGAKKSTRDVFAIYGPRGDRLIELDQNDHGKLCSASQKTTALARYRVAGVTARLAGVCGHKNEPSCHSKDFLLQLTWTKHGKFYQVSARSESRHNIVGFARGLRRVH